MALCKLRPQSLREVRQSLDGRRTMSAPAGLSQQCQLRILKGSDIDHFYPFKAFKSLVIIRGINVFLSRLNTLEMYIDENVTKDSESENP